MLSIEQLRHQLKDSNWTKVARAAGVSYMVLWRFMNVEEYEVRHSDFVKLSDYVESLTKQVA